MEEEKKVQEQSQKNVHDEVKQENFKTEGTANKRNIGIICLSGLVGILIGALIVAVIWKTGIIDINNKTVAKLNSTKITDNDLYEKMKEDYPIDYIIEIIDEKLVDEKYPLTDDQEDEIDEQVDTILNYYAAYGYTEEAFLAMNGFDSKESFRDYLAFDYQRNLVFIDYLDKTISKDEIEKYYNENVYGEINTKHMLVQVTDNVKDEDALKKAKEIIKKLDEGEDFDKVAEEYGDEVIFEELGYNGVDSNLVSEYVEASKKQEVGTYSKTPVKTEYGYHIIYKIDEKEMPTLEEAKESILEVLGETLEAEDENIRYKALIEFRKENGLEFKNEEIKKQYEDYCKTYEV